MGKQRTPQGRQTGRGTTPRKAPAAAVAAAGTVASAAPQAASPASPASSAEPLHAHLMDTVSSEALAAATPAPEPVQASTEAPVQADADLPGPVSMEPVTTQATDAADAMPDPAPTLEAAPAFEAAPPVESAPSVDVPAVADPVAHLVAPPLADPYANVVPLKSAAPVPAAEPPEPAVPEEAPAQPSDGALPAPAAWRAGRRTGVPIRQDLGGMGETLFAFVRTESSAALAHLNALKDARSPADAIRLQVNEIQRAADASLTCWSEIARRATRIVAQR